MAPETYLWHYMQQRGVQLFKGGLFYMIWWGEITAHTFMEIYVWPFYYIWVLLTFVFWHSAALGLTKSQLKELMQ